MIVAWSRLSMAQRQYLAQAALNGDAAAKQVIRMARARDFELAKGDMMHALAVYDGAVKVLPEGKASGLRRGKRGGAMQVQFYNGTGVGFSGGNPRK